MGRHNDIIMDHRGLAGRPDAVPVILAVACEYGDGGMPRMKITRAALVVTREEYENSLGYQIHQCAERCRRLNGADKATVASAVKGNPDGTAEAIDVGKLNCGL